MVTEESTSSQIITPDIIKIEEGLRVIPGANTVLATFDKLVNWSRYSSLWPMTFGLA